MAQDTNFTPTDLTLRRSPVRGADRNPTRSGAPANGGEERTFECEACKRQAIFSVTD